MARAFLARDFIPWRRATRHETARDIRRGPRIAVVGNCQARVVAQAIRVFDPSAQVTLIPMAGLGKEQRRLAAFAESLSGFDAVFSQPFAAGFFPDGGADALLAALPRARLFPAIVFNAFHPDAVYVGDLVSMARTRLVPSPMHTYHSAITLFGHLRGLPPERIARLFREDVFARLGYLDAWPRAAAELTAAGEAIGFDLRADMQRWGRSGAFMHNINHPKLFVLGDVARRLLYDAGFSPAELELSAYLVDELVQDAIWPIYEPVAAIYGVSGSYLFKRRQKKQGEPPSLLGLDAFVAESLEIYRTRSTAELGCERVAQWSRQPDICALFDAA